STRLRMNAEQITKHLYLWRESFRTALVWFVLEGFGAYTELPNPQVDREGHDMWWGYRSDLRHAGVRDAANAIRDDPSSCDQFPGIWASYESGLYDSHVRGDYPLPSSMQNRLAGKTMKEDTERVD